MDPPLFHLSKFSPNFPVVRVLRNGVKAYNKSLCTKRVSASLSMDMMDNAKRVAHMPTATIIEAGIRFKIGLKLPTRMD